MNCSDVIPSAEENLAGLDGLWLSMLVLGVICTMLTIAVYSIKVAVIRHHLAHCSSKNKLVIIIGTYPVIAFTSLVAVMVPRAAMIILAVDSLYISACTVIFLQLIIEYFGVFGDFAKIFEGQEVPLRQQLLICVPCLPRIKVNGKNFRYIKLLVGQIVFIRPAILFVANVLWADGIYESAKLDPTQPHLYLTILDFLSILTALYSLGLALYIAREPLRHFRLARKMIILKLTFVCTKFQSLVLNILISAGVITCQPPYNAQTMAHMIHHYLLIFEMTLFSLITWFMYDISRESELSEKRHLGVACVSVKMKNSNRELHSIKTVS